MSSQLMADLMERFTSIRMSFYNLQSFINSYSLEGGQFLVAVDPIVKMQYEMKNLKKQINDHINDINNDLVDYENMLVSRGPLLIHDDHNQTQKYVKQQLYGKRNNSQGKSHIIVSKIRTPNELERSRSNFDSKQSLNTANVGRSDKLKHDADFRYEEEDLRLLQEALKHQRRAIENLKRENEELEDKFVATNREHATSIELLKQCRRELQENKTKLKFYQRGSQHGEKEYLQIVEQLNQSRNQIQSQKDQLKIDYDLIKALKDEIIKLHHQIREMSRGNDSSLPTALNDDKQKIETLTIDDNDKDQPMNEDINMFKPTGERKKKLSDECERMKKELEDVKKYLEENKKTLTITQNGLHHYTSKIDNLNKDLKESKAKINVLSTMKSISEEKIKLLNQFIEDFRIKEMQFHNKIVTDNNGDRLKMEIMEQAYEKLF